MGVGCKAFERLNGARRGRPCLRVPGREEGWRRICETCRAEKEETDAAKALLPKDAVAVMLAGASAHVTATGVSKSFGGY